MQTIISQTPRINLFSERRKEVIPGVVPPTSDGALWFHPYNGDAPWQFGAWDTNSETVGDVSDLFDRI
jgi:hypothetical protein